MAMQGLPSAPLQAQDEPTPAEVEFGKNWLARISAASSAEDMLVAAMFAQLYEPSRVPEFLDREFTEAVHEKVRLSIAWYYCRDNAAADFCRENAALEQLVALDPANLEPHLYAAIEFLEAGEDAAGLAALATATRSIQANTYYLDKLFLLRERLAASGYPEALINWAAESFSRPIDTYFLYARLAATCARMSKESLAWSEQCFALGSRLETLGTTVVQNVHGFAMQRDALAEGDPARAAIVARMAAFNHIRDLGSEKLDWWADVSRKPDVVYAEIRSFGEIQAVERALQRHDAGQ